MRHSKPAGQPVALVSTRLLTLRVLLIAFSSGVNSVLAAPPAGEPTAPSVAVATVIARDASTWNELSGRLEAVESVVVRPRVGGILRAVEFREGAMVRKGDLLATIDPEPYAAEVSRAEAQVAATSARLVNARTELERTERLAAEDAVARRELDERSNAQREADANLRGAMAALQLARLNLEYTRVTAPISGRVGRREVTTGNLVAAGPDATALTTLVSVNPIYASFDAEEETVVQTLEGVSGAARARARLSNIPVEVRTAEEGSPAIAGSLQFVDNLVDAKTGTVHLRAILDNKEGKLIPGQFVTVRLGRANKTRALLINERAVGTDQDKKFVFVVGDDNRAAYREVSLGGHSEGMVIVLAGLKAEERVVVNGLQRVRPGSLVAPQPVAMDSQTVPR